MVAHDHEKKTITILKSIQYHGGFIREGQLPHSDHLTMFRLTDKGFLEVVASNIETGENLYGLTTKGEVEARKLDN
jgi:hypothetical protein